MNRKDAVEAYRQYLAEHPSEDAKRMARLEQQVATYEADLARLHDRLDQAEGELANAWIKNMIGAFPGPQPDPDDDKAVDDYARQMVTWAKAHDPEGFAAHWEAFATVKLTSMVEDLLEADVEAGLCERVVGDDGRIGYRRLSAR